MAQSLEQILGKTINSTKELRAEINALKDSLVQTEQGTAEWEATATKLVAAQEKLSSVTQAGKASFEAAEDSIVGLEQQYKALYNTYKLLTEEQRNSDFGKEMGKSLKELSNKLNDTKKDVGNFKDNIGRYTDSAMDAFNQLGISIGGLQGPMKLASMGANGLGAALKSLIMNPVGAVIMAIVLAFKALSAIADKVKEAINGNEESQMRMKQAMSAFQPVLDAVTNAWDWLGQKVVSFVEFLGNAFKKIMEFKGAVTDFLGITDGAQDAIRAQNELYAELAAIENEITLQKREQLVLNEADQAKVEDLKEQAAGTEDVKRKTELLTQAKELQNKITERSIILAEAELELMRRKAELTPNDTAANDAIAEQERKVNQIRRDGATKTKELTSQILSLTKATKSYGGTTDKAKEEAKAFFNELLETEKTLTQRQKEEQQKRLNQLKKYGYDVELYKKQIADAETKAYIANNIEVRKGYDKATGAGTGAEFKTEIEAMESALLIIEEQWKQMWVKILGENTSFNGWELLMTKVREDGADFMKNFNTYFTGFEDKLSKAEIVIGDFEERFSVFTDRLVTEITPFGVNIPKLEGMEQFIYYVATLSTELNNLKKQAKDADVNATLESYVDIFAKGERDLAANIFNVQQDPTLKEEEKLKRIDELNKQWLTDKAAHLEAELALEGLSFEQKIALEKEYWTTKEELRQMDVESAKAAAEAEKALDELKLARNQSIWDNSLAAFSNIAQAIGSISNTIGGLKRAEIEEGNLSEKEIEKKKKNLKTLEKIQLAVSIAAIAADTAAGIMGVWRGYGAEKFVNAQTAAAAGPAAAGVMAGLEAKSLASAILQTTGIAIAGAANIAAAAGGYISNMKAINDIGGGGADAAAVAPAQIDSSAYNYTRQLQTDEEVIQSTRPIWVSVTDIENGLNTAKVVSEETSF